LSADAHSTNTGLEPSTPQMHSTTPRTMQFCTHNLPSLSALLNTWLAVTRLSLLLLKAGLICHLCVSQNIRLWPSHSVGRDSLVGTATGYGLDGPGIESRWGRDFPHPSRPVLGPTQPPIQWVPGLSRGVKRLGRGVDHRPPSSAEVKERVELYFCSPTGPSWSVIGWTLLTQSFFWKRLALCLFLSKALAYGQHWHQRIRGSPLH
jgi:hypothetical protein